MMRITQETLKIFTPVIFLEPIKAFLFIDISAFK